MTLIGLSGFIGSGKDTVAAYLVENHGFISISYASALKDIVSTLFGWDRTKVEGTTKEDRQWREEVDTWWETKLDIQGFTPRVALQKIGTDVFRTHFHPSIWIAVIERKIINLRSQNPNCRIIVTDCRFINEAELIHKLGGKVFRIVRDSPKEYNTMMNACLGDEEAIKECKQKGIHPSEYNILSFTCNGVIQNDGSLDDLYAKIDALF